MPSPCDSQVTYEQGILYFYHRILWVKVDNPCDGEMLAPFDYDIYCYWIADGMPYTTDPPPLDGLIRGPVRRRGGEGCTFSIACNTKHYIIFATRAYTFPEDPWERTTSTCSGGSANQNPNDLVLGELKFHLTTTG